VAEERAPTLLRLQKESSFEAKQPQDPQDQFPHLQALDGDDALSLKKDIVYIMRFLGNKNIKNTLIYVQLEEAIYNKEAEVYISKAASTVEEVCKFVAAGFEYVCDVDEVKIFRKRA